MHWGELKSCISPLMHRHAPPGSHAFHSYNSSGWICSGNAFSFGTRFWLHDSGELEAILGSTWSCSTINCMAMSISVLVFVTVFVSLSVFVGMFCMGWCCLYVMVLFAWLMLLFICFAWWCCCLYMFVCFLVCFLHGWFCCLYMLVWFVWIVYAVMLSDLYVLACFVWLDRFSVSWCAFNVCMMS